MRPVSPITLARGASRANSAGGVKRAAKRKDDYVMSEKDKLVSFLMFDCEVCFENALEIAEKVDEVDWRDRRSRGEVWRLICRLLGDKTAAERTFFKLKEKLAE